MPSKSHLPYRLVGWYSVLVLLLGPARAQWGPLDCCLSCILQQSSPKAHPSDAGVCALVQVKTSVEDAVLLGDVSDHRQDSETTLLTGCFPPRCHDTLLQGPAPFEASARRHWQSGRGRRLVATGGSDAEDGPLREPGAG